MESTTSPEAPLFTAVAGSARQLFHLLRCIGFASKAELQISGDGLRFTVEESQVMQGQLTLLISACRNSFTLTLIQVLHSWKNHCSQAISIHLLLWIRHQKEQTLPRSRYLSLLFSKRFKYSESAKSKTAPLTAISAMEASLPRYQGADQPPRLKTARWA